MMAGFARGESVAAWTVELRDEAGTVLPIGPG